MSAAGLQPSDVNLVTVGMGGNDAKFGEIVAACLFPNIIRELLREYPDAPREIDLLGSFVTCERLDKFFVHSDEAIDALAAKETWAQGQILSAFPVARVLQVNYPSILPAQKAAPATCGGIRKGDIDFARQRVAKIDKVIAETVQSAAAGSNGRIELVDLESSFGPNALCPSHAASALANGVDSANFKTELRRLLNVDGNGDAEARRRLDTLVDDYHEWKRCAKVHYVPFGEDCNVSAAFDRMKASALAAVSHLRDQEDVVFANLMAEPSATSESVAIRFDRSRGLFHPNEGGQGVMACRVLGVFGAGGCPTARAATAQESSSDSFDGKTVTNAPIETAPGAVPSLSFGGFAPGSRVTAALHSQRVELGAFTADSNGVVSTSVTMPSASPGVHTLELHGTGGGGVDLTKQTLVKYPGRPREGDSYATYLCCFDPEPASIPSNYRDELVDVIYLGDVLTTLVPDEDGGVLVEVPLVDPLTRPDALEIQVRSQRTGRTLSEQVSPTPSVAGLWATGTGPGALSISGAFTSVNGLVHSDGDLAIAGVFLRLTGGVEHVGNLTQASIFSAISPAAAKVAPGGSPVVRTIEEFRPGSPAAVAAGEAYTAIAASECRQGTWRPAPSRQLHGIVYVPCAVEIVAQNATVSALIAAEGPIGLLGREMRVEPDLPGLPSLVSGAQGDNAIRLTGANLNVRGTMFAPRGGIQFVGMGGPFRCGAVASTIRVVGGANQFVIDEGCLLD